MSENAESPKKNRQYELAVTPNDVERLLDGDEATYSYAQEGIRFRVTAEEIGDE